MRPSGLQIYLTWGFVVSVSLSLSVPLCLPLRLTDLREPTGTSLQINALPVLLIRQVLKTRVSLRTSLKNRAPGGAENELKRLLGRGSRGARLRDV